MTLSISNFQMKMLLNIYMKSNIFVRKDTQGSHMFVEWKLLKAECLCNGDQPIHLLQMTDSSQLTKTEVLLLLVILTVS